KQSPGEILRADRGRTKAPARGNRQLESACQRHWRSADGASGGSMKLLAWFRSAGAKFFRRARIAEEMDEELSTHIQLRADDLERSGLTRAEAVRRARIEFGAE